jgi:hypothetical protein
MATRPSWHKRAVFVTAAILVSFGATEGLSLLLIHLSPNILGIQIRRTAVIFQEQSSRLRQLLDPNLENRIQLDSVLGWRYRAGFDDGRGDLINSQGLRSTREYAPTAPPGVLRVAAFGDSFVYGNEVGTTESWPSQMERLTQGIEVLNYGVGGYGVDQAYLRFLREAPTFSPDVVIIAFVPDDLRRAVNVYRRFISDNEIPLVKPRFLLTETGDLTLLPSPFREQSNFQPILDNPREILKLGTYDQWFEPAIYRNPLYDYSNIIRLFTAIGVRLKNRYFAPGRLIKGELFNESSTAFKIHLLLFDRFVEDITRMGAIPLIVVFPDKDSVMRARRGRAKVFDPLLSALRARGMNPIDLTDAFLAEPPDTDPDLWYMPGGHYSAAGNLVVARWIGSAVLARQSSDRKH